MFLPKYQITEKILANIKKISVLITELNYKQYPDVVLLEFEKTAREVSSFASTSIEGNPLPLTEVKKILKSVPANIRDSEKEVLNYNAALNSLNEEIKTNNITISSALILEIHKKVMQGLLPHYNIGAFRKDAVVVNDPRTGQIIYLPPEIDDVNPLVDELIKFILSNKDKIDPLILAGIFHKQFVLIHPFMDGNGRTTRLTTKVLLAAMGLDTFNLFSFENYYNKNVTKYFQTVGEKGNYYDLVNQIDFTNWLEYFTEGIIDELLRVQKILPVEMIKPEDELKAYHTEILKIIQTKGFIRDSDYANLTDRAKATRALDFQKLIKLRLIKRMAKGKASYYVLN